MAMPNAFTDPDKLAEQVDRFFATCEASREEHQLRNGGVQVRYRKPPSVIGLAVYLGVSRQTLYRYMAGDIESLDSAVYSTIRDILVRARDRIEALTLEGAMSGEVDSKAASLVLGGMGYSNKSDDSPTVTVRIVGADAAAVEDWSR